MSAPQVFARLMLHERILLPPLNRNLLFNLKAVATSRPIPFGIDAERGIVPKVDRKGHRYVRKPSGQITKYGRVSRFLSGETVG
jgi:hypothetical protein